MGSRLTSVLIVFLFRLLKMNFNLQRYFQKSCNYALNHQRILLLIVACMLGLLIHFPVQAQRGSKIRTVVIDPGHGGRDPGAVGKRSKEKDIVLKVALQTGEYINQYLPDVKVIYTRTKDEFIELHRRAAIANENNADVFISIHCNAIKSTAVHGAETFVMGEHRSQANLDVAKLENAAILLEENADEQYGGFDPNSPEAYIAFTLYQSENKSQSIRLAQKVQEQFTTRVGRRDRSVQQAGFLVLYRTTMPSILVELGFITNPTEEAFLMSEQGQTYMASAIFRAFRDFKKEFELDNATPLKLTAEQEAILIQKPPAELLAEANQAAGMVENPQVPNANKIDVEPKTRPAENANDASSRKTPEQELVYKVQFATNRNNIPLSESRFSKVPQVEVYFHDGLYKYTSGRYDKINDASRHQAAVRQLGYTDAFVVAFYKGERIGLAEARKIEEKQEFSP
jgi:N-acetylmuramoyl-L-alanine amidase